MSSYNNIRKIKYTKTPSDVVSLQEYIIFEDTRAKEKYVVFRFSNNVNQRLFEMKFEVLQYNADNELLEKSVVLHNGFVAEANDLFVPKAKLKINFECQSLEVRLESASFDRVLWCDGEFKDNSYRFESYAESVSENKQKAPSPDEKKRPKQAKKRQKKNKFGFNIRNIFRRNKAVFPSVFNVILCLVFIALVVFSTFYFKNVTGAFVVDDYIVKESSSGYVTVLGYNGQDEDIEIPSKLDDYYVTKIGKGAFRNSALKNLVINTARSLVIETGAFRGCDGLTKVTASSYCGEITLMSGAFTDCKALTSFNVPTAKLCKACFDGTDNIKSLVFNGVVFSGGKLIDVFNGLESITLDYLYMNTSGVSVSFLEGVTVRR